VYESVESGDDGERVLVERMWPRGFSKQDERVTRWFKEIAPTDDLRRWFHETGDFANFSKAYRKELEEREDAREALNELTQIAEDADAVTLVFASKDEEHNSAVILRDVLEARLSE
jgi:uncharacterized protein YeaO (DUF488 family)